MTVHRAMTVDHAMTVDAPAPSRSPRCPLCGTAAAEISEEALTAGGHWRCATCDQTWTARRLATMTAYAAWVASRRT